MRFILYLLLPLNWNGILIKTLDIFIFVRRRRPLLECQHTYKILKTTFSRAYKFSYIYNCCLFIRLPKQSTDVRCKKKKKIENPFIYYTFVFELALIVRVCDWNPYNIITNYPLKPGRFETRGALAANHCVGLTLILFEIQNMIRGHCVCPLIPTLKMFVEPNNTIWSSS